MECIANECVPTSQVRQALVPEEVSDSTRLDAQTRWKVGGVTVVQRNAELTIEPGAKIEMRAGALIVIERGATVVFTEARPDLEPFMIDENIAEAE